MKTFTPTRVRRSTNESGNSFETHYDENHREHREDGPAYTVTQPNGVVILERWSQHGKLHRLDGPASISRNTDGAVFAESWYDMGKLQRLDGPAEISYKQGQVYEEKWFHHGRLYRVGGPAKIRYHDNGAIEEEQWSEKPQGMYTRLGDDLPAKINYHANGVKKEEQWYLDNYHGREGKPASLAYDMAGNLIKEVWYHDHNIERDGAPAIISYYPSGAVLMECFCPIGKKKNKINMLGPTEILYSETGGIKEKRYWHDGARVPEHVVMNPAAITVDEILAETDANTRLVMISRMGYDKFMDLAGATLWDENRSGQLLRLELPKVDPGWKDKDPNEPMVYFKDWDDVYTRVPPRIQSVDAACKWLATSEPYVPEPKYTD